MTPLTYLITFACYGCHLHGEESGSVSIRATSEEQRMDQPPYYLDRIRLTWTGFVAKPF